MVRRINAAAAVTPVNLVALALLSTNRQALDEGALIRAIDLYLDLLKRVPYSTSVTLPEGDGQAIIEEVRDLGFLSEQQDALGRILYLDEQNAVLMTYYRNNVLHLFAIPALIASFFQNTGRMTRELIHRFALALYPYLQAELFIHWEREELRWWLDGWLEAMVERGLLRIEDDVFVRAAPSSRQFVRLTLLARAILQTLQRYYMTTALILNHGQNSLTAPQLEELCTVMAQRLSVLHGLNAPEFFDKSLFRHFIQTLLARVCCARPTTAPWAIMNCSANWPKAPASGCCRRRSACRSVRWRWTDPMRPTCRIPNPLRSPATKPASMGHSSRFQSRIYP